MILKVIAGIIAGMLFLSFCLAAAVGAVSDYMKEQDKRHRNWFDPRNDRTF